jgi:hypothetical protein
VRSRPSRSMGRATSLRKRASPPRSRFSGRARTPTARRTFIQRRSSLCHPFHATTPVTTSFTRRPSRGSPARRVIPRAATTGTSGSSTASPGALPLCAERLPARPRITGGATRQTFLRSFATFSPIV